MRVAFDISPISSGHMFRGIGSYTSSLQKALLKIESPFEIDFTTQIPTGNYDLIHYPYFDFYFHTLPLYSKAKTILTVHDAIPLVFPQHFPAGIRGNINLFLQKLALKKAAFVICDSLTSAKDIEEKLSIPKNKLKVIYLAPGENFKKIEDTKALNKVKVKYNLPERFCVYIGDVNWNKNLPGLVEAVRLSKIPLVMVGKALRDGKVPEVKELDSLIEKSGISSIVFKTGFVTDDELVSIYNLAKFTVLPSFYEGFGLPVLESMACGVPVVCSNNSSLSEITDNSTAFYCDPSDPKDIAVQMRKAINLKADERNMLGDRLTKHASFYTWEKVAKETLDLYSKVLGLK